MAIVYVDDKNFEQEVSNFQKPKMVVFYAEWCPHCHRMVPVLEEVAKRYEDKVKVCVVNISHAPKAAAEYAVRGVPTMLFFKDAKHSSQLVGEEPIKVIEEKIKGIL